MPGRGHPLQFTRTYNALQAAQDGPLGFGWTDSYSMELTTDASANITVSEETGSSVMFAPNGSGGYSPPSNVLASLVSSTDGSVFTFTRKDQEKFIFTAPTTTTAGLLTAEVDRNGYATTLSYTSGNKLARVTDPAGRSLQFAYNAPGRIASISDPISRTVVFTYDTAGNLTAAQDVDGGVTQFSYDPAGTHRLLTMTDPRGRTVTNVYDSAGRVITQTDPLSRTTAFTYTTNANGAQTTTITDPVGNVTVEQYENNLLLSLTKGYGSPQQATWSYTYDPATLGVASVTDPNGHTSYNTWDANGNLVSHTDALGRTTSYAYDSLNDTTAITDLLGVTTAMSYDVSGNLITTTRVLTQTGQVASTVLSYDPAHPGDVIARTDPDNHTWRYTYDTYGNLSSVSDPISDTSTYTYDLIGRKISVVSPRGNVVGANPISYTTTMTYDAFGNTTAITDPLGNVTRHQYDADQNLITTTDALLRQTVNGYDLDNERVSVRQANGALWQTGYDADGNVITATDPLSHTTLYAYDALNRRINTTDPLSRTSIVAYDLAGNVITTTDPLSHTTVYGYDAANEQTSVTHPDGGVVRIGYDLDGRVITTTDALTHTTWFGYDSLNRKTSVTDPLTRTATYTYDLAGNEIALSDPLSRTTLYGYDIANRRISVTRPDSSVLDTGYDADGNVITTTDGLNHLTRFSYDVLDRKVSVTDPLTHTTTYSYDAVGNPMTVTDPLSHTTTYQYDLLNRVITATDPLSHTTLTGYDPAGNVVTSTDALSHTTIYGYDAANQRTTETRPDLVVLRTYYNRDGNVITQTDGLSRTTTYGYDLMNRIITATDPLTRSTLYTYDLNGNRISRTDALSHTTLYGYDADNELITTTYALTTTPPVTYTYTPSGQRATMIDGTGTSSYSYDLLDRLITSTTGAGAAVGYRYDAADNLTTLIYPDGSIVTRTYDLANRLTGVTDWQGHTTSYAYDAADRVITQTYPNTTTASFSYDNADGLTGITDRSNGYAFWSYSYGRDALEQVSSASDPLRNTQDSFTYDSDNRLSGASSVPQLAATLGTTRTGVITTVAGTGTAGYSGDGGPATLAQLSGTFGAVADSGNNLYVADQGNNRIREVIAATGLITTVAGTGSASYSGDGGPARQAALNQPSGVAVDALGDLFIVDQNNNRIREVVAATGIITTVAGKGTAGYSGDGGLATQAQLNAPNAIALDGSGNLYIADVNNNRVRAVSLSTGVITTVAGTGIAGYSGDGGLATHAQLNALKGLAVDRAGNLYIADAGNYRVREVVVATGLITTVVGTGNAGYSGDGGPATAARIYTPKSLTFDAVGNLYIVDAGNNRIREVLASTGIIATVAGSGTAGYSGDGGAATAAQLNSPKGVALDGAGDLFIVDSSNSRVREVGSVGVMTGTAGYGYDNGFNLTANSGVTQTYDMAHQLSAEQASNLGQRLLNLTPVYNADGDRIGQSDSLSGASTSAGYDQENRLITVTNGLTASVYGYNGDGLRMSKAVSGGAPTQQVWDVAEGLPQLLQDGTTRYVPGLNGQPLEAVAGMTGTVLYHYQDQLGSTRLLLDGNGQTWGAYSYGAYGQLSAVSGGIYTSLLYGGQYRDGETGLYYLRARYYDPTTAQFLSVDPLVDQTGQPYAYATDDPVNAADPSGQDCSLWALVTGGCRLPTWQEVQATWNNEVRPETYGAATGVAGFFDSLSGGYYSQLAATMGAPVNLCSADYQSGVNVAFPFAMALSLLSEGALGPRGSMPPEEPESVPGQAPAPEEPVSGASSANSNEPLQQQPMQQQMQLLVGPQDQPQQLPLFPDDMLPPVSPDSTASTVAPRDASGRFAPSGNIPARYSRANQYPHDYRAGVREQVLNAATIPNGPDAGMIETADGKMVARDNPDITIEHDPSIVSHWNEIGRFSSRQVRNDYYNNVGNLTILLRSTNSSRGAMELIEGDGFIQEVGPGYSP